MASLINCSQGAVAHCVFKAGFCKAKVSKGLIGFDKSKWLIMNNHKKKKALIFLIKAELKEPNYEEIIYAEDADIDNYSSGALPLRTHDDNEIMIIKSRYSPSVSNLERFQRFMEAILEMSRLQNFVPSTTLVLIGAWLGSERSMEVFTRPISQVWISIWCSNLIIVASMLVNDIFDFRSGTDQANGKTNPLLRGEIDPYHVELVALSLYGASIIGLCYLESMSSRLIVGLTIVTTYIYTPILKHIMMVKNLVVSGAISSCLLLGALTTGSEEQLQNPTVIGIALYIFLCFLSREIIMDVGDIEGDKAAGVNTIAVRFGGQIGTLMASIFLVAANALLIGLLATKAQNFSTIGTLILLPLHAKIVSLCKDLGDMKEASIVNSIDKVVQQSIIHIGFGAIVLAFMA